MEVSRFVKSSPARAARQFRSMASRAFAAAMWRICARCTRAVDDGSLRVVRDEESFLGPGRRRGDGISDPLEVPNGGRRTMSWLTRAVAARWNLRTHGSQSRGP